MIGAGDVKLAALDLVATRPYRRRHGDGLDFTGAFGLF